VYWGETLNDDGGLSDAASDSRCHWKLEFGESIAKSALGSTLNREPRL